MLIPMVVCLLMPGMAAAQSLAPAGWDAGLKLNEPADLNPEETLTRGATYT